MSSALGSLVYGTEPRILQQAPGGRENAKMVGKQIFANFSLPQSDGNYFLRPDRILGAFLLDPADPIVGGDEAASKEAMAAEKARDATVKEALGQAQEKMKQHREGVEEVQKKSTAVASSRSSGGGEKAAVASEEAERTSLLLNRLSSHNRAPSSSSAAAGGRRQKNQRSAGEDTVRPGVSRSAMTINEPRHMPEKGWVPPGVISSMARATGGVSESAAQSLDDDMHASMEEEFTENPMKAFQTRGMARGLTMDDRPRAPSSHGGDPLRSAAAGVGASAGARDGGRPPMML